MSQKKLLFVGADGIPTEHNGTTDDVTFNSYTVQGGGPVLSTTGLDMNNQDVSDVNDLAFNDPTTGTINQTAGNLVIDNIMAKERSNVMTTAGDILFPVITDAVGQVDAFRLPALAGVPTAAPAAGGEGFLVWDSTGDRMFAWNGSAWDDLSTVQSAQRLDNLYTAAATLAAADVVYISAADTVDLADVSGSGAASRVVGVIRTGGAAASTVEVTSDGIANGFSALTVGARYYADPATPGAVTATTPTGSGNTIVQIGYAKSATEMHLQLAQLGRRA